MGRNPGRPIPEGAHANHRVQRLDVDVGDRREIQVDSGLVEITADRGGHVAGQREVIDLAQGQVAWIGAARPGLQTGDVAALLVDRNHRVGAALMELGAQPGDLLGRVDVSREQHHTAQAVTEAASQPCRRFGAFEPREQAGLRQPFQLRHQPFTAPAVSPVTTFRCTIKKKTTTGIAVSVAPAINGPQSAPRWVVKDASQTLSVCFSWLLSRTYAMMYSLQACMKPNIEVATNPGATSGKSTRMKAPNRVQPSIWAASSSSTGTLMMKPRRVQTMNGNTRIK